MHERLKIISLKNTQYIWNEAILEVLQLILRRAEKEDLEKPRREEALLLLQTIIAECYEHS